MIYMHVHTHLFYYRKRGKKTQILISIYSYFRWEKDTEDDNKIIYSLKVRFRKFFKNCFPKKLTRQPPHFSIQLIMNNRCSQFLSAGMTPVRCSSQSKNHLLSLFCGLHWVFLSFLYSLSIYLCPLPSSFREEDLIIMIKTKWVRYIIWKKKLRRRNYNKRGSCLKLLNEKAGVQGKMCYAFFFHFPVISPSLSDHLCMYRYKQKKKTQITSKHTSSLEICPWGENSVFGRNTDCFKACIYFTNLSMRRTVFGRLFF